jgi:hypothetical protein
MLRTKGRKKTLCISNSSPFNGEASQLTEHQHCIWGNTVHYAKAKESKIEAEGINKNWISFLKN